MRHFNAFDIQPRCTGCGKLLAERVTRPWVIKCGRCKTVNSADDPRERRIEIEREWSLGYDSAE